MSDLGYYLHLQSKTMNPCSLEKRAYAEATGTWLCSGCARPKPGVDRVDAHIQDDEPEGPLNFVNGCGLPLARVSFLLTLGEERVKRDLNLGQVFGPNRSQMPDWATFRGRQRLIVRGSKHVSHRVCPDCGRDVYFAMGTRYLYPAPPRDVEIFESDLFGLILPESVATDLDIGEIRGVTRERLKVLQEPRDSLPALSF